MYQDGRSESSTEEDERYKAPGLSGLVTEMIQATGDTGTQWILDLCNGFVKEGSIPDDWKCSVLLLVSKIEFKWHQMVYCSSKTLDYTEPKNVPGGTDVPNFIKIGQTVAEIWRFNVFFKMAAVRHLGFVVRCWDHPRWPLGGLYRCAEFV